MVYHPDYGYISLDELIEEDIILYTGITPKGDRVTSWEYKVYDSRTYIAKHLVQEDSVFILNRNRRK